MWIKHLFESLHRWQVTKGLSETEWSFTLSRGYGAFSQALAGDVHQVPRRRFISPWDYSFFNWAPYGYWDAHEVFVRLRLRPNSLTTTLASARRAHFEGRIVHSGGEQRLVGSYRLDGFHRIFVLVLLYVPVVLIPYIIVIFPFLAAQRLRLGENHELMLDMIMAPVVAAATFLFWGFGHTIGRLSRRATERERDTIRKILERASS